MRHQKKTVKLGRTAEHRKALLANQVCSLIEHSRIKTTLAKAKAVRPFAEKMLTLGKHGTLHDRRNAIAYLHQPAMVKKLFEEIAPRSASRQGGYTRIIKLGRRLSDSAEMAYIEWVDNAPVADELAPKQVTAPAAKKEAKPADAAKPAKAKKAEADDDKSGAAKKRDTGSRKAADKAKRALSKTRKQTASSQQSKPKLGGSRPKNKGGSKGR